MTAQDSNIYIIGMLTIIVQILIAGGSIMAQLYIARRERSLRGKEREEHIKMLELERTDKFRLCSIEERLKAHQEAFTLWYKLHLYYKTDNRDPDKQKALKEAREWWVNKCLYLTPETSEAFSKCVNLIAEYWLFNLTVNQAKNEEPEMYKTLVPTQIGNFQNIMSTGKIITEQVGQKFFNIDPEKEADKSDKQ